MSVFLATTVKESADKNKKNDQTNKKVTTSTSQTLGSDAVFLHPMPYVPVDSLSTAPQEK